MRRRFLIRALVAVLLAAAPTVSVTRALQGVDSEDSVQGGGDAPQAVTTQVDGVRVPRGELRTPWGLGSAPVPLLTPASARIAYAPRSACLATRLRVRPSGARAPPVSRLIA